MRLLHPTRRRLRRWMSELDSERIEKHLSRCDRCSARLEAPDGAATLRELLAEFIAAPTSIEEDMVAQLALLEKQHRDNIGFIVDLFGVWLDTGRVVFGLRGGDDG